MDKIDIRDLILRELKKEEIQVDNYNDAVFKHDYVKVAESIVENLPIYVVMQQRELLLAFMEFYFSPQHKSANTTFAEDVDAFLANNCA